MSNFGWFKKGLRNGIPIFLGYLVVSFTFGIAAKKAGLSGFEAVLMSASNLTSAGQFAALDLIASSASYFELAFTQLIINARYCLMSSALSQKFDAKTPFWHRFIVAYGVSDEIFAVSIGMPNKYNPFFGYGLITISTLGWSLGTLIGVVSGSILPPKIISALSIALYGMLIAVIISPTRKSKIMAGIVIISMLFGAVFTWTPLLKEISSGFRIIILTVIIASVAAILFPIKEEKGGEA